MEPSVNIDVSFELVGVFVVCTTFVDWCFSVEEFMVEEIVVVSGFKEDNTDTVDLLAFTA